MTFHKKHAIASLIILLCGMLCNSCFTVKYDFKGGISIDPQIKTFSVQYFDNRAPRMEPTISQRFSDGLKDYIEGNTRLRLATNYGDVDFSGIITDYSIEATAITTGDQAAKTRFTIAVKVTYKNLYDQEADFEETFSRFREFDANEDISSRELDLSNEIIEEIVELIFNRAFVNW